MRTLPGLLLWAVACSSPDPSVDPPADASSPVDGASTPDAAAPLPDAPACVMTPMSSGVSTLAGCALPGTTDGPRAVARFANPTTVLGAPDGTVYVADFDNDRIRAVDEAGTVTTLVDQRGFRRPFGMALAADGTFYVQTDDNDLGQHSTTTGTIWTVNRVTGAATVVARDLGRPRGLAVLADGRLVLSDYAHGVVRILDPDTGTVSPLAGAWDTNGFVDATGGDARFAEPYGVAILGDGRIAVADRLNHRIRGVALDGTVTTLAGTGAPGDDDGAAALATFRAPADVAVDGAGNLYVADQDNFAIRRIAAGQVTTVAGSGVDGWLDADDPMAARLHGLEGIDVRADGARLWIGDGSRGEALPFHRVRVLELHP